ncbi:hypothetical protein [Bacillus cereus]|nr:hypothetical protein [Bacillus cereus]
MLKFIFALFLIVIFTVTGFFTFSYFATGEYDGAGINIPLFHFFLKQNK